jgi:steroid delta-isomerase-like uncharacterized protein
MHPIDLVLTVHEIWNTGNLALIEKVYAPDFVAHWPSSSQAPERRGLSGVRFGVQRIRQAFPDWHERVEDIFAAEDGRVASRYVSTGTHGGVFWGLEATGRKIEIQEISIYRVTGGVVAEQWCLFDELGRLQQLGVRDADLERFVRAGEC